MILHTEVDGKLLAVGRSTGGSELAGVSRILGGLQP